MKPIQRTFPVHEFAPQKLAPRSCLKCGRQEEHPNHQGEAVEVKITEKTATEGKTS